MNWKIPVAVLTAAAVIVGVVALATSDDGDSDKPTITIAEHTDGAFTTGMVPHHEDAIEMAKIAQENAEHRQVKMLAGDIIAAQESEIAKLTAANDRLFGEPVSETDHGDLGLDESEMGMDMDPAELEQAKPFDRAFIDMMVLHHQGAIRMARVELAQGQDPELQSIASAIIEAQASEIREMNAWRQSWYGAPSPAGGVPPEGESSDSNSAGHDMDPMEGMEGM